ncbi:MAG: NAD(P)-dependent oxidoreductase [Saprospiraceae bacterium]|nr:NAD(P)-dependent oxidoreductase [Saprospiraceae bacterium]
MKVLVTGASGKVGQRFIEQFLLEERFSSWSIRAFCHNRIIPVMQRLEVFKGDISSQSDVSKAMEGITHVLHLATSKESPDSFIDTSIKGMFWLLEACRRSKIFQRFVLIGGDASVGHFFYQHPTPITENQGHSAYPGCYALSKVLEEVMLEQYYIQYDISGCCLRAPWIMEKDDFRYTLSFGDDVFGGPVWSSYVSVEESKAYFENNTIPLMLDINGKAMLRNFVHLDDLVAAILLAIDHPKAHQQLFNICMDEPIDYQKVADYLRASRGFTSVPIKTEFKPTWLDNTKAKFLLDWRPRFDYRKMIDHAFDYIRDESDPRVVWYPG